MTDERYELAYDVAAASVSGQRDRLENLRARAGLLLAAAAVVTSFLGGQALDDTKAGPAGQVIKDRSIETPEAVAIAAFIGLALCAVAVLLPWRGWLFGMNARQIIRDYIEADKPATIEETQRDLALHLERHYNKNKRKLTNLYWAFRVAAALLAVEAVGWMIDLT
jgi:hypothetical protein